MFFRETRDAMVNCQRGWFEKPGFKVGFASTFTNKRNAQLLPIHVFTTLILIIRTCVKTGGSDGRIPKRAEPLPGNGDQDEALHARQVCAAGYSQRSAARQRRKLQVGIFLADLSLFVNADPYHGFCKNFTEGLFQALKKASNLRRERDRLLIFSFLYSAIFAFWNPDATRFILGGI
jgi:hypothetical protein